MRRLRGTPEQSNDTAAAMPRLILFIAAVLAAVAAWLSQGTLALATLGGPRIALVQLSEVSVVAATQ